MQLTLGFSPCPNDTFIFDALVNQKIDTGDLKFKVVLEDVQTLNEWAQKGRLDLTKVSYGVVPSLLHDYTVLKSGGALGKGVGPLLISDKYRYDQLEQVKFLLSSDTPVAIPGQHTTAHFLFSQAFPHVTNKHFLRFNEIENWVIAGNGLGVIIHENRFTYAKRGLYKIADLGTVWEMKTGLPIPLGGIVAKRSIPTSILIKLNALIQASIGYAWSQYPTLSEYVKMHAQEMEPDVMKQHIDLYVNDFSDDVGTDGRKAILSMLSTLSGDTIEGQSVFF